MLRVPIDHYGYLRAPHRAWSYPPSRLVRVQLEAGAVDWTAEALDACANVCEGADVMVEAHDPRLAADFTLALGDRLRQRRGSVA